MRSVATLLCVLPLVIATTISTWDSCDRARVLRPLSAVCKSAKEITDDSITALRMHGDGAEVREQFTAFAARLKRLRNITVRGYNAAPLLATMASSSIKHLVHIDFSMGGSELMDSNLISTTLLQLCNFLHVKQVQVRYG